MSKISNLSFTVRWGLVIFVFFLAGSYGFLLGKYQVFPAKLFKKISSSAATKETAPYERNAEIFPHAFTKGITKQQLYPAVKNLTEITTQLDKLYFPAEQFFTAYAQLRLSGEQRDADIFRVDYQIADREYSAFAYRRDATVPIPAAGCATLIIPGSGKNQSTPIFQKDLGNYHDDILSVFEPRCDSYVLVKPNEDFLAIHDGKRKLDYDFILRYLLNKGGSYSAHYLVSSLALTKYLQQHYGEVYVAGLSQGGEAALLNALQSQPTAVVVASGFSLLSDQIDWAGFNQIIIPGLRRYYTNERIYETIANSKTRFLFTYGKSETGTYRVEAEENLVCNKFGPLKNVDCATHPAGHAFDNELVRDFISQ